jgi:ELWxxDGT repeat protein
MSLARWILPGAALATLSLLPHPALGQGSIGPLERIQTFPGFRGAGVTASLRAGSLAFFTVDGPYTLQTFWRSDGTAQGTFQIGPRNPTPQTPLHFWTNHGDLALFTWALDAAPEDRSLWRSDGTDAGTFPITQDLHLAVDTGSGDSPTSLSVPARGLAFFAAGPRSESPDLELWATDGTVEGTRLVEDVNPAGPSNPSFLVELGGRLFFLADTPQGRELWRSDGTAEGTERVQDFHESGDAIVTVLQAGGALLLLVDRAPGVEVWRSDGTEAGTTRVLELPALRLHRFTAGGRRLFLMTFDASGQNKELWAIDGAAGGAVRFLQATIFADIDWLAAGDSVVFRLEDDHGVEPWWSDGTPEGTHRIADLCPGSCSSNPRFLGASGGRAVLAASSGVPRREKPWVTDGTASGTYPLGDSCPDECDSELHRALDFNGWLLLYDESTFWISDGTRNSLRAAGNLQGVLGWIQLPDHLLIATLEPLLVGGYGGSLWSIQVTAPPPPQGGWLTSGRVPGFRVKVRIAGQIPGRPEPACIAETLCVSGALRGRSELFVRILGPKPNGYLWPTLVRFTTSTVEVWIEQMSTGVVRYYRLEGVSPDSSDLSGLVDRQGFLP